MRIKVAALCLAVILANDVCAQVEISVIDASHGESYWLADQKGHFQRSERARVKSAESGRTEWRTTFVTSALDAGAATPRRFSLPSVKGDCATVVRPDGQWTRLVLQRGDRPVGFVESGFEANGDRVFSDDVGLLEQDGWRFTLSQGNLLGMLLDGRTVVQGFLVRPNERKQAIAIVGPAQDSPAVLIWQQGADAVGFNSGTMGRIRAVYSNSLFGEVFVTFDVSGVGPSGNALYRVEDEGLELLAAGATPLADQRQDSYGSAAGGVDGSIDRRYLCASIGEAAVVTHATALVEGWQSQDLYLMWSEDSALKYDPATAASQGMKVRLAEAQPGKGFFVASTKREGPDVVGVPVLVRLGSNGLEQLSGAYDKMKARTGDEFALGRIQQFAVNPDGDVAILAKVGELMHGGVKPPGYRRQATDGLWIRRASNWIPIIMEGETFIHRDRECLILTLDLVRGQAVQPDGSVIFEMGLKPPDQSMVTEKLLCRACLGGDLVEDLSEVTD